jgi:hypothetical protein
MRRLLSGILTTVVFLTACQGAGNDEFVGKWVHVKSEKRTMEIVRNGGSYIGKRPADPPSIGV